MEQGLIVNERLLRASQIDLLEDLFRYLGLAAINWSRYGYVEKSHCLAQLSILLSRLIWLVADKEIT